MHPEIPAQNARFLNEDTMSQPLSDGRSVADIINDLPPTDSADYEEMFKEAASMGPTGDPTADALIGKLVQYALTRDPAAVLDPHEFTPTVPDTLPPAAEM